MRKKIGRKIYDTEKSKEVGKQNVSYFGDSRGFEEIMFEKAKDDYFLLVKGGHDSQYPEEDIIPLSLEDAKNWLERICGHEYANEIIPTTEKVTKQTKTRKTTKSKKTTKPAAKKTTKASAATKTQTAAKAKTAEKAKTDEKTTTKSDAKTARKSDNKA